ncbi:MAG: hypothetical protein QXR48_00515 [Candidatus Woesearchaeota archaeon]
MNKRAIELQFNWIFILIAGALIIAFFFSVVQKQRALSEEKLSITLASQMDAVFSGAIESKGTGQPLATPKPGIAFYCSEVCDCFYKIGKKSASLDDKILFAPSMLKEQDARALALEWKFPFRVANFLLLTNPGIKYYFVYDSGNQLSAQLYQKIRKALKPEDINAETVSSPDAVYGVAPQGYMHTRFVFIGTGQPSLDRLHPDFADEDVSGVWISENADKVVFFEKSDPDELYFNQYQSLLAGDVAMLASVYAADHLMYDCMLRQAFGRLGIIAQVHSRRAKMLQSEMESLAEPRLECSGAYAVIIPELEDVAQKSELLGRGFPDEEALRNIAGAQSKLQQHNQNLILQSCPELY